MLMAGIHIVPFEKPYMITFTMFTPMDRTATKDNEIITRVFNSFHSLGERPIKYGKTPSFSDAADARNRTLVRCWLGLRAPLTRIVRC
jgi:hypothetical protein